MAYKTRRLALAALCTACTISFEESSRKHFKPGFGLVMIDTAPADKASKAARAPFSASEEQTTTGVGRSAMILFRKLMPSMRGLTANIRETIWRTSAESSTIGTLILSAMGIPDACIAAFRKSQPDIAAP